MKKIIHIIGARPNFIKAAPLIKQLNTYDVINLVLHTGQHYDKNMSDVFFEDLEIPKPNFMLSTGGGSHTKQTAKMMIDIEEVFVKEKPNMVIVYGDVNSCIAATLVASKLHLDYDIDKIEIVHVESGLRSNDRTMPEELNRLVTDDLADHLFVTCEDVYDELKRIGRENIYFTGNTMIDSLVQLQHKFDESTILDDLGLDEYCLITLHRPYNVDTKDRLKRLMDTIIELNKKTKVVFPIHPRTRNKLQQFGLLEEIEQLDILIEPQGYIDFMCLQKNAKFIVTDSGGIQEESSFFNVPCLTARDNTERPITITQGTNRLIGTNYENILNEVDNIDYGRKSTIKNWDGIAAVRGSKIIWDIIETSL